jgi:hypothetical protein
MNIMTHEWNKNRSIPSDPAQPGRDDGEDNGRRDYSAQDKKTLDDRLELGLEETFPASDAVAVIQPRRSSPERHKR